MTVEQDLWIAVIEQAFKDAFRNTHLTNSLGVLQKTNHALHVDSAKDFLTSNTKGFKDICCLAGLEPGWVMGKYRQLLSSKFTKRDRKRFLDGLNYTH
jgi:hypothetical protein